MNSPYSFVVSPIGGRYNNTMEVGDKSLIVNTEVFNHQFSNRTAKVISVPSIASANGIKPGDTVILHHNVFRRWHDIKGKERNSKAYFNESTYVVSIDQIFLYKSNDLWKALDGYCFVQPVKSLDKTNDEVEKPCVGIVKYTDGKMSEGDLVGFTPFSTYEFIIDGQRLYRVYNKFITIKYEYQGNEEEYNPSWA